jgi:hypothetical protein
MLYGSDYEGRRRECDNCGHVTNVYAHCAACDMDICEGCDHTCECKTCHQDLDEQGLCRLCDTFCSFCGELMLECACLDDDDEQFDEEAA